MRPVLSVCLCMLALVVFLAGAGAWSATLAGASLPAVTGPALLALALLLARAAPARESQRGPR